MFCSGRACARARIPGGYIAQKWKFSLVDTSVQNSGPVPSHLARPESSTGLTDTVDSKVAFVYMPMGIVKVLETHPLRVILLHLLNKARLNISEDKRAEMHMLTPRR